MQELLTGKKRLPGFAGAVATRSLGDLGRWTSGMTLNILLSLGNLSGT
jgi:hypothetical protein